MSIPALPLGLSGGSLVVALNDRLRRISDQVGAAQSAAAQTIAATAAVVAYGSHAQRISRPVSGDGTFYVETDRGNVVYQARGTAWAFVSGRMDGAWATLPTDLGAADTGFVFFDNVNSLHVWEWSGSAWTWGPGDRHSGEFGQFDAAPGTGWHLCDGGTATKYAADGTRNAAFTVPDQREFYLKASATYTGTGAAAVAPGLTGSTASGVAAIGNDTDTPVLAIIAAGTTSVAISPHTHVDAGHVHAKGTLAVDATATPASFAVLPYYRL